MRSRRDLPTLIRATRQRLVRSVRKGDRKAVLHPLGELDRSGGDSAGGIRDLARRTRGHARPVFERATCFWRSVVSNNTGLYQSTREMLHVPSVKITTSIACRLLINDIGYELSALALSMEKCRRRTSKFRYYRLSMAGEVIKNILNGEFNGIERSAALKKWIAKSNFQSPMEIKENQQKKKKFIIGILIIPLKNEYVNKSHEREKNSERFGRPLRDRRDSRTHFIAGLPLKAGRLATLAIGLFKGRRRFQKRYDVFENVERKQFSRSSPSECYLKAFIKYRHYRSFNNIQIQQNPLNYECRLCTRKNLRLYWADLYLPALKEAGSPSPEISRDCKGRRRDCCTRFQGLNMRWHKILNGYEKELSFGVGADSLKLRATDQTIEEIYELQESLEKKKEERCINNSLKLMRREKKLICCNSSVHGQATPEPRMVLEISGIDRAQFAMNADKPTGEPPDHDDVIPIEMDASGSGPGTPNVYSDSRDYIITLLESQNQQLSAQNLRLENLLQQTLSAPAKTNTAVKLPDFDPNREGEDPKSWCATVECCLDESARQGGCLVVTLGQALKGEAATWFTSIVGPDLTWDIFKSAFLAQWDATDTPSSVFFSFLRSQPKDTNESYVTYASRMIHKLTASWKELSHEEIAVAAVMGQLAQNDSRVRRLAHTESISSRERLLKELRVLLYKRPGEQNNEHSDGKKMRFGQSTPFFKQRSPAQSYPSGSRDGLPNPHFSSQRRTFQSFRPRSSTPQHGPPFRPPAIMNTPPKNDVTCFSCSAKGHISTQCPKKNPPAPPHKDRGQEKKVGLCQFNPVGTLIHKVLAIIRTDAVQKICSRGFRSRGRDHGQEGRVKYFTSTYCSSFRAYLNWSSYGSPCTKREIKRMSASLLRYFVNGQSSSGY
ncbi:unnamed protein product [Nesidiocoris tenuis]|uniref:CCHC-type domain-containing protein n=1 Tax=Nesidiocoris tenuis TaxID=355587 RepID=A0A6H5FY99_9HEMI|nr:unnamed protein product [Nesidiocoris tenuis]